MSRAATTALIVLVIGLVGSRSSAQVNMEKLRRADAEKVASATLELDLAVRTGNVETFEVGVGGRIDYFGESATVLLVGEGDLGWQGGERYSNNALVHLRQVYRRQSRMQPELFAQTDYDKSRNLAFRGLIGGGLRIGLYQARTAQFWLGSAYMFEHERLDPEAADTHSRRSSVHRSSNYLSSKIQFNEQTALAWTLYLQPQFDDPADLRFLSEGDLEVKLRPSVLLVTTSSMRYDSHPPSGTHSLDTALKSGVAVKF